MDTGEKELNKALIAFSDQTIYESHRQISNYVQSTLVTHFSFENLFKNGDQDLISGFENMLESTASEQISAEMPDEELFDLSDRVSEKIMNWDESWKDVLDVALVKKILENFNYTNRNMNQNLLKSVYLGKHTEDLFYIWISAFREKLRNRTQNIDI